MGRDYSHVTSRSQVQQAYNMHALHSVFYRLSLDLTIHVCHISTNRPRSFVTRAPTLLPRTSPVVPPLGFPYLHNLPEAAQANPAPSHHSCFFLSPTHRTPRHASCPTLPFHLRPSFQPDDPREVLGSDVLFSNSGLHLDSSTVAITSPSSPRAVAATTS